MLHKTIHSSLTKMTLIIVEMRSVNRKYDVRDKMCLVNRSVPYATLLSRHIVQFRG